MIKVSLGEHKKLLSKTLKIVFIPNIQYVHINLQKGGENTFKLMHPIKLNLSKFIC